ncbi:MAG: peptidoglycan DD-metalloendopeptidase family protein [Rhodobacteraceae bacterium]|nr:peptidoglycan DD-metalloendopeptidase family protein [Paracoccaceae bacterium]
MRKAALLLLMLLPGPLSATAQDVAAEARAASTALAEAVAALEAATGARDRVSALTDTIRAYEAGLAALREALRQAAIREAALQMQLDSKSEQVAQLLGVLSQLESEPGPLLLLHPSGPVGTVQSGLLLTEVTPALQAEAEALKAQLGELRDLRALQVAAGATLTTGLAAAQTARTALSQAISDRTDLPRRFTEDPDVLRGLLESADTLDAFAGGLSLSENPNEDFTAQKGRLPLPAFGTLIRRADEADAAGVRRPGISLATRPRALVTAPHAATIRYLGPLFDYGNVMVLEPGGGYLVVLAGLDTVYGSVGEVVAAGAPVGLMGGGDPTADEFLANAGNGTGTRETETLYIELRQGSTPVDPADWFALAGP